MPVESSASQRVAQADTAGGVSAAAVAGEPIQLPLFDPAGFEQHGPWPCEVEPFPHHWAEAEAQERLLLGSARLLRAAQRS